MSSTAFLDHLQRRRHALGDAIRPSVLRGALGLDMSRASFPAPARVGFAVGIVLVVGGLTGLHGVAGFAALGALTSAFCRNAPHPVRARRLGALGAGLTATIAAGAILGSIESPPAVEIVAVCTIGAVAAFLISALHITGPGAVVFVFAATAAAAYAHTPADILRASAAAAIGALVGTAASLAPWALERIGNSYPADTASPTQHDGRAAPTPNPVAPQHLLINSARIWVAGIASAAIATAIGLSHPMWAAMGAIATMQAVAYHLTVVRGIQRLVGNIAGAVVAAALLGIGLDFWGAVIAIIMCQVIAEYMATVNYAITSFVVTPMALLLTSLGTDLSPQAALDRAADTLVGVVIGILVAALAISGRDNLSPRNPATATSTG